VKFSLLFLALSLYAQQTVDAVAVISMPVERKLDLPGELLPFQQAALRSPKEATIEKVFVDRGSRVAEGELLATLSDATEIRAPFAGIITARYMHPGELAGPHDGTLFDLAQTSRLRLVVAVPEESAGSIPKGDITFRVPAYPGNAFHGAVMRNAGALDPKTHTLPVEVDVRNPNGRLMPGMRATTAWRVLSQGSMTLVPPTAIATVEKRTIVAKVRNNIVEWIDVVKGESTGDLISIQGPLDAGDVILRQNPGNFRPGTRVYARLR
jgi:RND family efflux transporter MFP subunit